MKNCGDESVWKKKCCAVRRVVGAISQYLFEAIFYFVPLEAHSVSLESIVRRESAARIPPESLTIVPSDVSGRPSGLS